MQLYTASPFLDALQAAWFDGRRITSQPCYHNGQVWQLPMLDNGRFITDKPFIDFFEPVAATQPSADYRTVKHLPHASYGIVSDEQWQQENLSLVYAAAPFADWSKFATWDDFTDYVTKKRTRLLNDSRRRYRKLRREVGEPEFIYQDNRPETLQACIRWKCDQFANARRIFSDSGSTRFLEHMQRSGFATVSSFSAGGQLMAVHLGVEWQNRFYSWMMAYNNDYSQYAAGRLMTEQLLEASHARGDHVFDFMLGSENFKWWYGTHSRLIAPMGGLKATGMLQAKKFLATRPALREKIMQWRNRSSAPASGTDSADASLPGSGAIQPAS